MPSPFPGMDPFLEVQPRWERFHGWFIRKLAEVSLPKAKERGCWIDVERSIYHREPSGQIALIGEPDVFLGPETTSFFKPEQQGGTAVALAEPEAVHEIVLEDEELAAYKQDYLVVRDLPPSNRVLAVVEVLSPANKEGDYAVKYREKRARFLASRAHFMEIDFLRDGENPARDLFPELPRTPYFIFVARKTGMGRLEEGYPIRLQEPLPIVGLPLGPKRTDLPLDLPAAFQSAYDLSERPDWICYHAEPVPGSALSSDDADFVRKMVEK